MVDHSLRVLYCNPAWDAFARANGGTDRALGANVVGQDLLTFIPDVLHGFYADHLNTTLTGMGTWKHDYECSTPSEFRVFRLQACPLTDERELLLCHAPMLVRPHYRDAVRSLRRNGLVRMCSHCRRTSRNGGIGAWDWIPEHLAHPPENRKDDLCESCAEYYSVGRSPWPEAIWRVS